MDDIWRCCVEISGLGLPSASYNLLDVMGDSEVSLDLKCSKQPSRHSMDFFFSPLGGRTVLKNSGHICPPCSSVLPQGLGF